MRPRGAIAAMAVALLVLIVGIKWVGGSAGAAYLRRHATPWDKPWLSPDGRYQVVVYRYPQLHDVPESLGFGQGFVQLQEAASGRPLAEQKAEDLASLNRFRWSSNKVAVADLVEWDLPP